MTPATMRAAVLVSPGSFDVRSVPLPIPAANQLRVHLQGCGVCASNLPPFEGREWFTYPMEPGQLGHESWGIVDQVDARVSDFRPGDRVAMLSNHAYAEYDVADEDQAVRLPASLEGLPFPAEPLGCAINILRRSGVKAGDVVAIVGVGFLGALLIQLATHAGARVIAIGRRPFALHVARGAGAAEVVPIGERWEVIEQVKQLTGGRLGDVVIECVGKQEALDLAGELTTERGRLIIAGYHQDGLRSVNLQLWNWRGLDVINAHERDPAVYLAGMRAAVAAVAEGSLKPEPLYTHRLPLERLSEALTMTRDRPEGFMKAWIDLGLA